MADEPGVRLRAFCEVNTEMLVELFKSLAAGEEIRVEGLPADARVVGTLVRDYFASPPNVVHIALESETFDAVPQGQVLPRIDLTFTIIPRLGPPEA